ncbi:hypothetical protein ACFQ3Y_24930 [Paenibacillus motobuensis]|uniref:hypothetical protein n=1 Tax=Paenibacillus motobuensis TaxID=295324 RepID=UPI00362BE65E
MDRETATFTCPKCRRRHTVLADEYEDHGCVCGWEPRTLDDDVREYVECCVDGDDIPDALDFSMSWYPQHRHVPGQEIAELIAKELAKYEQD